ncbi:MAG: GntR family transcriptional regulator [Acidobacteriia bacterium]|nr:GntR family transcriptional regulator [Terriglobia bacterium]
MERSQIHRVSVADQVAGILRQKVLRGEFRPGTSLQEIPLAEELGVSRNTMREAMRILSLEGLLKRSINRGIAVAQLSLKDVHEIYHVRRVLEISAVHAAKKPAPDLLREIRAALEEYEDAVRASDWVSAVSHDLHFHSLLIRFLGNRRIESFYQKTIGELRMGMVLVDRRHDRPDILVPAHRKLYQLLTAGKRKECAAVLARHLDDSESRLSRVMDSHESARVADAAVPKSKRSVRPTARVHD